MTDHGRTTLSLREFKDVVDQQDKPNSEYVRDLIREDQQYQSTEEVKDFHTHRLEQEIEQLQNEATNRLEEALDKIAAAEELEERLKQIKDNNLLPQDKKAVEEYLEKVDGEGGSYLNPLSYWVEDNAEGAQLSKKHLIKEVVKRADSLPELDAKVARYRDSDEEIVAENVLTSGFDAGIHDQPIGDEFLAELIRIRDDVLAKSDSQNTTKSAGGVS